MIANIFLARPGAGAFERHFTEDAEFDPAGVIEVKDPDRVAPKDVVHAALEVVFSITNSYPGELHCADHYADQVATYRQGRHRSLSVGDVVGIGEGFYFCASSGWEPVLTPSPNLMAACVAAMPSR